MKIKISVIMPDEKYLSRFADMAAIQYADKMDVSVFTQIGNAAEFIKKNRPDIVLVEQEYLSEQSFSPESGAVSKRGFSEKLGDICKNSEIVCFLDEKDIHTWNGYRTVCKYQKFSDIYKCIAEIYAEKIEAEAVTLKGDAKDKRIITFFSGAGGVGASTAAASYARYLADQGESVLYLNLEQTGTADQYFSAEGEDDFGRVIYALEVAAGTPAVRMENALRQDACGVYFYSACAMALDMMELNEELMEQLFEALGVIKLFRWIVVDMDFSLGTLAFMQIERSYATFFVSDGSGAANVKLSRKLAALEIAAQQRENLLLNRIFILYNRFGSRTGKKLKESAFKEIGGIHRFEDADTKDLLKLMSQNKVFREIYMLNSYKN